MSEDSASETRSSSRCAARACVCEVLGQATNLLGYCVPMDRPNKTHCTLHALLFLVLYTREATQQPLKISTNAYLQGRRWLASREVNQLMTTYLVTTNVSLRRYASHRPRSSFDSREFCEPPHPTPKRVPKHCETQACAHLRSYSHVEIAPPLGWTSIAFSVLTDPRIHAGVPTG